MRSRLCDRGAVQLLSDEDVRTLPAAAVVDAAREALVLAGRGQLVAPPRVRSQLGEIDYVYTAGALGDGTSGFRVYRAGEPAGDQLVAVWDADGRLTTLVVGHELGARRTGALGAAAADVLARPDADTVGVIGTGRQAWTQLWALAAVRDLRDVRVYSREERRRQDFAARARKELGVVAKAAPDPASAIREAAIVVLATTSPTPVIDAEDVAVGTHVTTVGPKSSDAHETPLALVTAAAVVTCDSPQQAAAYSEPFFTGSTPLVPLADVILGRVPGRQHDDDITLHCSVGLAGSEVVLADRLVTGRPR